MTRGGRHGEGELGWDHDWGHEREHPVWALFPGARAPAALAGWALPWPLAVQRWPARWGPVVADGVVFEPLAVLDAVLAFFARNAFDQFEAEHAPPWVFAWHGVGGWRLALIDEDVAADRAFPRDTVDDSTPLLWAPLPELRLLPMLGEMLPEAPAVLADWFEDRGDCETAERLRVGARTPLETFGPNGPDS